MNSVERKQLVLFAAIADSLKLFSRLGDTEGGHTKERCFSRLERAVGNAHGRLLKASGDEVVAIFKTAEDALRAAIEMQERVGTMLPVSGTKIAIRVGFDFGSVVENAEGISGRAIDHAKKIALLAQGEQILASQQAVDKLPVVLRGITRDFGLLSDEGDGVSVRIAEVHWRGFNKEANGGENAPGPSAASAARSQSPMLCVRYHGRAYLLDNKTATLSLGRGEVCDVVIEDRKASRLHAWIERRNNEFYYVDQSTNGSYVCMADGDETLLQRKTLRLYGTGTISFGCSAKDPLADCMYFEHL